MRLLFVHGARVYAGRDGGKYTDGSFTSALWSRYADLAKDFHVLLRDSRLTLSEEEAAKYSRIDENLVKVTLAPDSVKPKTNFFNPQVRMEINRVTASEVKCADAVIIRLPSGLGERAAGYARKYGKPYLIEDVGDPYSA